MRSRAAALVTLFALVGAGFAVEYATSALTTSPAGGSVGDVTVHPVTGFTPRRGGQQVEEFGYVCTVGDLSATHDDKVGIVFYLLNPGPIAASYSIASFDARVWYHGPTRDENTPERATITTLTGQATFYPTVDLSSVAVEQDYEVKLAFTYKTNQAGAPVPLFACDAFQAGD